VFEEAPVSITSPIHLRGTAGRRVYAAVAAALLVALILAVIRHGAGIWQIAIFGLGPDLALFAGAGSGLENGQLHPRAVRAYNLAHSFSAPVALAALAALGLLAPGFFVGALAWAFHIALDRSLGYGSRTRDGFQRS
jgi:Domain of unknown function (DUF4260)